MVIVYKLTLVYNLNTCVALLPTVWESALQCLGAAGS